jgi:hypothetical protein
MKLEARRDKKERKRKKLLEPNHYAAMHTCLTTRKMMS